MKISVRVVTFFAALPFISVFPVAADELRLKNGDRPTGKVMTMEENSPLFQTSYAGQIAIQWSEVPNLKTDEPIRVVLNDETLSKGRQDSRKRER